MKEKFGFVTLLDALGARSATTRESLEYLRAVKNIRHNISSNLQITLDDAPVTKKEILAKLRPRFFGDSILLTYAVHNEKHINDFVDRLAFTLALLIPEAMTMGILFRGAISIGEYLESDDVVLGPAVVDAANWYEQMNMIGVMFTPRARHYLNCSFLKTKLLDFYRSDELSFIHEYGVPIKNQEALLTYAVKWPSMINAHKKKPNHMQWYYETIRRQRIPIGAEEKYVNTEEYLRHVISSEANKVKSTNNKESHGLLNFS